MKKITMLLLSVLFFDVKSNGQITKGNWLVGGDASLLLLKIQQKMQLMAHKTLFSYLPMLVILLQINFQQE